jgi:hypothetical protein
MSDIADQVDKAELPRLWTEDILTLLQQYPGLRVRPLGAARLELFEAHYFDYWNLTSSIGLVDGLGVYANPHIPLDSMPSEPREEIERWKRLGARIRRKETPERLPHVHIALEETPYIMMNKQPIMENGREKGDRGGYVGDLYEILSPEHLGKKRRLRR